ncbi:Anti-sigma regulatory factor (Ser/Thr protein kinase) [Nonomuraea solani]|uniref:Anti-sigma regulatory factor (Ser/Thr protein kinase) n=2 Tax=Nonomuraea solani TaxID=1144553 RepID=A0A1H6EDR3_9ACTN|nr:Anti-sigma regulatory factor (Ser/Thr protein kinase) [Nonomuraea solani]
MAHGLRGDALQDLVITVNEAASNALEHGGSTGTATLVEDGTGVQVEIVDSGGTLEPYHLDRAPDPRAIRGMGLWIIQRICRDVTVDHPGGQSRLRFRVSSGVASGDKGDAMPGSAAEPLL